MGKGLMFLMFVWLIVCIAGGVMGGDIRALATTELTADITDADTTIPVTSTEGFPDAGFIQIGNERIAYSHRTADTFTQYVFGGDITNPVLRGTEGTEAVAHSAGADVRTVETYMQNASINYNVAVIADASGLWAAATIVLALLRLLSSFFVLPATFLGTNLALIGVFWWVCVVGMVFALGVSLAGGRRV